MESMMAHLVEFSEVAYQQLPFRTALTLNGLGVLASHFTTKEQ
jgi:hypothetical protein